MKKILITVCVCVSLLVFPCLSYAGHSKAGSLITTPILGASIGLIMGSAVAVFSSNATPILVGGAIGFVLGLALVLATPADEGGQQAVSGESTENPSGGEPTDTGPGRVALTEP